MKKHSTRPASMRSKFIDDKVFKAYQKPKMVDVAQEMLQKEDLSEEGFLGAQAVLLINGIL
jgi:hypothetical protein